MATTDLHTMLRLYHEAADGLDGVFMLVSIHAETGRLAINQFAIGDVDAMAAQAVTWAEHSNVYMPPAILRRDLPPGKRGTVHDIVAILGLVVDDDHDTGRRCSLPVGIAPTCVIATCSRPEVNRHVHFAFTQPLSPSEAAPLADLLHSKCGGDFGTKDIAHIWRLPGTLNHPNPAKIKRGRPTEPQPVTLAGGTFRRIDVGELRQVLEGMPDHRMAQAQPCAMAAERQRIIEGLPGRLRDLIEAEGEEDRSAHCFKTMLALMDHYLGDRDVRLVALGAPFARKFTERGDIDAEIARVRSKHESQKTARSNGTASPSSPVSSPSGARRTQADTLIEIASDEGVQLYHAPDDTAFADVEVDGHRETWPVRSAGFARWLRRAFFARTERGPNSTAMATALGMIEARAHYEGPERPVHMRVATERDRIYLDLCDPHWRAIEIDADGWRIEDAPPVRFRRAKGMLPLPAPVHGGGIEELREHLHVSCSHFVLVVSWLLAALRGRGPYPTLSLNGEQGTGKTMTADMLRQLVDPSAASLRVLPRDVRNLYVSAINGYVMGFDNLSSIPAEISDALCRLSTGGGFSVRALYTDSDEVLFDGQRPIVMTSITDVADRADLADRLILVRLDALPEHERKPEDELRRAFEAARPRILGALLDVVSHGLKMLPDVQLDCSPRMADYAKWMRACETAVWEPGTHMAAYNANRHEAVEIVLDADPVAIAVRTLMADRAIYVATATGLLDVLSKLVSEDACRSKAWPKAANALSGQLVRLAPALRRVGVAITFDRSGDRRQIIIEKQQPSSSS